MRVTGWKPPKVSCKQVKFGGQRHCGRGYIRVLVCHAIQQDHVMAGSFDVNGIHRHCSSGYVMVLVSHVIVQDYLTKGLNNFIGGNQSI